MPHTLLLLLPLLLRLPRPRITPKLHYRPRRHRARHERRKKYLNALPPKLFPATGRLLPPLGVGLVPWHRRLRLPNTVRLLQRARLCPTPPLVFADLTPLERKHPTKGFLRFPKRLVPINVFRARLAFHFRSRLILLLVLPHHVYGQLPVIFKVFSGAKILNSFISQKSICIELCFLM